MASLVTLIRIIIELLNLAILARVLISWLNLSPYHPVVQVLNRVTEPILAPIRRIVPPAGMMDLSPIVAIILLEVIGRILTSLLLSTRF
jgi:YggT family protein